MCDSCTSTVIHMLSDQWRLPYVQRQCQNSFKCFFFGEGGVPRRGPGKGISGNGVYLFIYLTTLPIIWATSQLAWKRAINSHVIKSSNPRSVYHGNKYSLITDWLLTVAKCDASFCTAVQLKCTNVGFRR